QIELVDYCQTDVDPLGRLLQAMLPTLDLPRALLRGRYMAAAAAMEWNGVPIDTEALAALQANWVRIKHRITAAVDVDYGVFIPTGRQTINPNSPLGAALLSEAEAAGIDPYRLADAVNVVWEAERDATAETRKARQAARQVTGLTPRRIDQWEDAGRDH